MHHITEFNASYSCLNWIQLKKLWQDSRPKNSHNQLAVSSMPLFGSCWHINSTHAPLSRDDGGLFLTSIYTSSLRVNTDSQCIKGVLQQLQTLTRSVERLGLKLQLAFILSQRRSIRLSDCPPGPSCSKGRYCYVLDN